MGEIKKVCMLTSAHGPLDDRIFYKEGFSLQKAGYSVSIIISTGYFNQVHSNIYIKGFKGNLLPSIPIIGPVVNITQQFVKFVYFGLKENADVYSASELGVLLSACFIKSIRKLHKRRVYIMHDVHDFYLEQAMIDKNISLWEKTIIRLLTPLDIKSSKMADFIIGTEEPKIEKYFGYGISPKKLSIIENYVRLDLFQFQAKDFNAQHFVLGYAGGLSFARGIDTLASAAVAFARRERIKVKLLLVGRFSSKGEEQGFTTYCADNKDFIQVEMTGWIPHPEVARQIARMDICFLLFNSERYRRVLSGKEGPIKLYEYMACGKPVIATGYSALRSVVEECNCGLIVEQQDSPEAVVAAIDFYFKHPHLLAQHGKNGRAAVEKQYNWALAEERLLGIYKQLA